MKVEIKVYLNYFYFYFHLSFPSFHFSIFYYKKKNKIKKINKK